MFAVKRIFWRNKSFQNNITTGVLSRCSTESKILKMLDEDFKFKKVTETEIIDENALKDLCSCYSDDEKQTKDDLFKQILLINEEINKPSKDDSLISKQSSDLLKNMLMLHTSSAKGLDLFADCQPSQSEMLLWDELAKKDFETSSTKPPDNQFEEWILWTKQGKLWHFPIDNDQGMDEEANTDFTKHVFLEEHLVPWCPDKGPLRKFMNLVLVGLSKNPYLTVEEKKEHIFWYRDYFEEKKKLLEELGAFKTTQEIEV